jgi:hypothetical protein
MAPGVNPKQKGLGWHAFHGVPTSRGMLMKRRMLLVAASLLVLMCLVALYALFDTGTISIKSYRRIRVGMSLQEVCAILGSPLRIKAESVLRIHFIDNKDKFTIDDCEAWWSENAVIFVQFDANGLVIEKAFASVESNGFLAKARRLLEDWMTPRLSIRIRTGPWP